MSYNFLLTIDFTAPFTKADLTKLCPSFFFPLMAINKLFFFIFFESIDILLNLNSFKLLFKNKFFKILNLQ